MNRAYASGFGEGKKHRKQTEWGTTLLELMVAVAVFIVISTAAFTLLNSQQNASIGVNGRVGMNMALRNTISMLQMDLANAGSYYFQASNQSNAALGVTMLNRVVAATSGCTQGSTCGCYTAGSPFGTYGQNCFDTLNIISIDATAPVVPLTNSTGPVGPSVSGSTYLSPGTGTTSIYGGLGVTNVGTSTQTTLTAAATAAAFNAGDQLLLLKAGGAQYTSVILTAKPTVNASGLVQFTFQSTSSTGSNSLTYDPLNISACSGTTPCPASSATAAGTTSQVTTSFNGTDSLMRLNYITYTVNYSNTDYSGNQNPILTRQTTIAGVTTAAATVMEQVIGFKVGGSVHNDPDATLGLDTTNYNYDSSSYTLNPASVGANNGANAYNFTLLQSIRVSLLARTAPVYTKNYVYRNTFDGGPYQVQGAAVVVSPRNMNTSTVNY